MRDIDTYKVTLLLNKCFRNDKSLTYSAKYSVTAEIMTVVIIIVSYIIPNISFNCPSDS